MEKIKIRWLRAGDVTLASTRLRCYMQDKYLRSKSMDSSTIRILDGNILILQKRMDLHALFIALFYSFRGKKVILDIDDVNYMSWDWRYQVQLFSNFVGGISTATKNQLILIENCMNHNDLDRPLLFDLENPIDYFLDMEEIKRLHAKKKNSVGDPVLGWFGNSSSFNLRNEVLELTSLGYKFVIISDINPISEDIRNLKFIKWELDNFVEILVNSVNICILSHYGDKNFSAKSANKMLTCLAAGIDVFVTDTPQYKLIAEKLSRRDFIYKDTIDLIEKIKTYRKNIDIDEISSILNEFTIDNYTNRYLTFANKVKPRAIKIKFIFKYLYFFIYRRFR